jgi:hypothetical protein
MVNKSQYKHHIDEVDIRTTLIYDTKYLATKHKMWKFNMYK